MLGGVGGDRRGVPTSISRSPLLAVIILMAGLQGSGKTTTSAKLAGIVSRDRDRKKVLLASLDTSPARLLKNSLRVLGREQTGVATLPIIAGPKPIADRAPRAMEAGKLQAATTSCILDTAGSLASIDEALMAGNEGGGCKASRPIRMKFCLSSIALTGQDAVNVGEGASMRGLGRNHGHRDSDARMDGDGRGGAALSMRAVTGKPIKLLPASVKMASTRSKSSIRAASPGAFSAWVTSSGLVEKRRRDGQA